MKKVIVLFFAAVLTASFSACANDVKTNVTEDTTMPQIERDVLKEKTYMTLGETFCVSENLDVTLKKITTTDVIEPMMYADYCYESEKSDCVMVDVVFEVENVGADEVKCREIATVTATGKAEYEGEKFFLEYNNYRSLAEHTALKSGEKTLFHAVVYVPKTEKNVEIEVNFDEGTLLYDYKIGEDVKNTEVAEFGEKIVGDGKSVTIDGIYFSNELHPSTESDKAYTYYRTDDEKTVYLIAEAVLENETDEDINVYDFVKLRIRCGSEVLDGMWVCESESGEAFDAENVIRGKSCIKAYYIAEVPKRNAEKQYVTNIVFDLKEYRLK